MKKLFLVSIFFVTSLLGYSQNVSKNKFSLDFQFSHLRSIYAFQPISGFYETGDFPFNFTGMMEVNYQIAKTFSIGGHFRYARTEEVEIYENSAQVISYGITSSPLLILAPNIEYNFPLLNTRNFLGIDGVEPFLAAEIGYAFMLNDKKDYEAVRPNGWIYTLGAGTKLNMNENFYFKLEANYNERLLGRFGLGWRL